MEACNPYHDDAPMPWEHLTKIKTGVADRHIEQLWDEIKSLKHRVKFLEEKSVFEGAE